MERIKSLFETGFDAWPYLLLMFVYLLVLVSPKQFRKFIFYISILIIIFFGGFKDNITNDLLVYEHMYENYRELSFTYIEPSFIFFSWIFKALDLPFYAISFLYFLLTIIFILLMIKNLTLHIEYSFFIYLAIPGFFLNTFVEMRQCLAVSIFAYAVSLFLNRRPKNAFVFFTISSLVHYSAIFAAILFVLLWKGLTKTHSVIFYAATLILGLLIGASDLLQHLFKVLGPFIFAKYWYYIFHHENVEILKIAVYFLYSTLIVLIWKFFKFHNSGKTNEKLISIVNLFVLGSFLILASPTRLITRIAYYFTIFQLPLVPNILFSLKVSNSEKVLLLYISTLYFLLQYIYGLFVKENGIFILIPYKNIFFEIFGVST